jgi:hypothetical protein
VRQGATVVNDTHAMRNETTSPQPQYPASPHNNQCNLMALSRPPPSFAEGSENDMNPSSHQVNVLGCISFSREPRRGYDTQKATTITGEATNEICVHQKSRQVGAVSSALAGFSGVSVGFAIHCYVPCVASSFVQLKIMELMRPEMVCVAKATEKNEIDHKVSAHSWSGDVKSLT